METCEQTVDVLVSGLDKVQEALGGYHCPSALLFPRLTAAESKNIFQ